MIQELGKGSVDWAGCELETMSDALHLPFQIPSYPSPAQFVPRGLTSTPMQGFSLVGFGQYRALAGAQKVG